jgi:beta-glucanase (GH16 family)
MLNKHNMRSIPFYQKMPLLLFFLLLLSCKKEATAVSPSNLTLEAEISNDGSGKVTLIASAENADRYYFTFGKSNNEEGVRSTDGRASTTYSFSGTFTVKVTAYSADNKSAEVSRQITVQVGNGTGGNYEGVESYPGMNLVWRDEFDGTSLNPSYWTFEIGNGTDGWGNKELQYYREENTTVKDGFLTITAKKETFGGREYTSSRIKTQDKKTFKYGRIDIRAKLPKGQGIWPALWMLGNNISTVNWPKSGEIDIMELIGGGPGRDNTTHGTLHYDNNGYATTGKSFTLPSGIFNDDFHLFTLVWTAGSIKWMVDNQEFYSVDISSSAYNEFHDQFFVLFNVAVGGNWPGSPNAATTFPQQMMVDFIRVFQ